MRLLRKVFEILVVSSAIFGIAFAAQAQLLAPSGGGSGGLLAPGLFLLSNNLNILTSNSSYQLGSSSSRVAKGWFGDLDVSDLITVATSTITNLTFTTATGTNLFVTNVSSTNATSTNANFVTLTISGTCTGCVTAATSTTFYPGLIWTNATGTNTTSTNLAITRVVSNFSPAGNSLINLGAYGNAWNNLYASGTSQLTNLTVGQGNVNSGFPLNVLSTGNFGETIITTSQANAGIVNPAFSITDGSREFDIEFSSTNQHLNIGTLTSASPVDFYAGNNIKLTLDNFANGNGIVPSVNNTSTLGYANKAWGGLAVSGTSFLAGVSSTGEIIPTKNNTFDLGASGLSWQNIYASGTLLTRSVTTTAPANENAISIVKNSLINFDNGDAVGFISGNNSTGLQLYYDTAATENIAISSGEIDFKWNSGTPPIISFIGSRFGPSSPSGSNGADIGKNGQAWRSIYTSSTVYVGGVSSTSGIYPTTNNTFDLGNYGFAFQNVYVSSTVFAKNVTSTTLSLTGIPLITGVTNDLCIDTNGNVTYDNSTACLVSNPKFKENIKPLDGLGLSTILLLEPIEFDWKPGEARTGHDFGFNAVQAAGVDKRLVSFEKDGEPIGFRYTEYTAILTKAIQEQQKEITDLKAEVESLKHSIKKHK